VSDLAELFARNPLKYTKDSNEMKTLVAKLRESRSQFNLGAMKAGSMKPQTEKQKAIGGLDIKLDLGGLLGPQK